MGIAYHQLRKKLYIIIAKDCLIHTYGVMRYKGGSPPLMIYTLKRDDIPLLSQWIKKLSFKRTRVFWLRRLDLNQRPSGYEPDELPAAPLRDIELFYLHHYYTQQCELLQPFFKKFFRLFSTFFTFTVKNTAVTFKSEPMVL